MWRLESFNETLIFLLLLFDVREQLLMRKKAFLFFKISHVTEMSQNELFLNFWAILGLFLPFYPINNPKKVFKKRKSFYICVSIVMATGCTVPAILRVTDSWT